MKKFNPQVNDKVGALTLLEAKNGKRRLPGWVSPNPANAHMGVFITDCLLKFKCSCGNELEHWYDPLPTEAREWPQDCGCGAGSKIEPQPESFRQRGRPIMTRGSRRHLAHYSLDQTTITMVENFAYENRIPISHAAEAILNAGFIAMNEAREKKRASFSETEAK